MVKVFGVQLTTCDCLHGIDSNELDLVPLAQSGYPSVAKHGHVPVMKQ
jgi:hypothetical protein